MEELDQEKPKITDHSKDTLFSSLFYECEDAIDNAALSGICGKNLRA